MGIGCDQGSSSLPLLPTFTSTALRLHASICCTCVLLFRIPHSASHDSARPRSAHQQPWSPAATRYVAGRSRRYLGRLCHSLPTYTLPKPPTIPFPGLPPDGWPSSSLQHSLFAQPVPSPHLASRACNERVPWLLLVVTSYPRSWITRSSMLASPASFASHSASRGSSQARTQRAMRPTSPPALSGPYSSSRMAVF